MKLNTIRIYAIIALSLLILYSLYRSIFKYYQLRKYESELFTNLKTPIERNDFDCYVINLKKNTERLGLINELYNNSDLSTKPFIRIEAVNGKEIDIKPFVTERVYNGIIDIDKNGERYHHSQMTRGAVGCYLSHLEIYKQLSKSKKRYGLIIEDDACLNPDIYSSGIRNILDNIPNDWDIILLGKIDLDVENKGAYLEMKKFWGTHGYLINQSGVSKMLSLANIPINDQIDAEMGRLSREGKLHIYAPLNQYIASNTNFNSEIQMGITEKKDIDPNIDPFK